MNAIEMLEEIRFIDATIDNKLSEAERLRSLATSISARYGDGLPRTVSQTPDKIGALVAKIVDLENEADADIDRYVDMKKAIGKAVDKLPSEERLVLKEFYFKHKKIREIAKMLNYSKRTVYRLKDKAVADLDAILNGV